MDLFSLTGEARPKGRVLFGKGSRGYQILERSLPPGLPESCLACLESFRHSIRWKPEKMSQPAAYALALVRADSCIWLVKLTEAEQDELGRKLGISGEAWLFKVVSAPSLRQILEVMMNGRPQPELESSVNAALEFLKGTAPQDIILNSHLVALTTSPASKSAPQAFQSTVSAAGFHKADTQVSKNMTKKIISAFLLIMLAFGLVLSLGFAIKANSEKKDMQNRITQLEVENHDLKTQNQNLQAQLNRSARDLMGEVALGVKDIRAKIARLEPLADLADDLKRFLKDQRVQNSERSREPVKDSNE